MGKNLKADSVHAIKTVRQATPDPKIQAASPLTNAIVCGRSVSMRGRLFGDDMEDH
jgi:hypothetical protein